MVPPLRLKLGSLDLGSSDHRIDQRTSGSSDQRIISDQRTSGPSDHRIRGSADHRTIGSSDHRTVGSAVHRTIGSSDRRIIGSSDQRIIGSSDQRTSGSADQRIIGSSDHRIIGSSDRRTVGSAAADHGPSDHRISGSQDHRIRWSIGSSDRRTIGSSDHRTIGSDTMAIMSLKRGWCRLTSHYYILPFLQVKLPYADLKQNLFFGSALRSTGAGGRETTGKTRPKTTQGAIFVDVFSGVGRGPRTDVEISRVRGLGNWTPKKDPKESAFFLSRHVWFPCSYCK